MVAAPIFKSNKLNYYIMKIFVSFTLLVLSSMAIAQNGNSLWKSSTATTKAKTVIGARLPHKKLYDLDLNALHELLAASPKRSLNGFKSNTLILLPNADGNFENFRVYENSVMEEELAANYPEIKSYVAVGVENPSTRVYFSFSPLGFKSMTLYPGKAAVFIEPVTTDLSTYTVYRKSDYTEALSRIECLVIADAASNINTSGAFARPNADDAKLRTFRLALSCTGEYASYFGGTKALALAGMNNTLTRCNAIFESDFGLRLILIANNDNVIYTSPTTDPYADYTAMSSWNSQLQSTLTSVIGESNYDIGHLLGASGGGGNAGCIGCVCVNGSKGSAYTSPSNGIPSGDNFDIDYVAHEIGHQLGANHTFTHITESGTGAQMEPGSGSTIMSYAGITTKDIQRHSDPYFHAISIQQVTNNIKAKTCPTLTVTGNSVPIVNAGLDFTIPKGTPFMLTGTATDANGDALTYAWEEMDLGIATTATPTATATSGPVFRSYIPTLSPIRYFPRMSTVLSGLSTTAGTEVPWEVLPTVARTLNFRLTVRDNRAAGPSNNSDDMIVTVNATAGPFAVSSPNTAVTYTGGSIQTITWSIAGTTGNGVNCPNVDILLSSDGGQTFPITLLSGVANSGSQNIVIPNSAGSTNRIMIKGSGHIFFDVSDTNFSIVSGNVVADTVAPTAPALTVLGTTTSTTNLSWSSASDNVGVTGYNVYQNGILKATISTTSYTVSALSPSATYSFYIIAKDAAGNLSIASNTVNVTTLSLPDTTAPTTSTLTASGTTTSATNLSWSAGLDNIGVTGYNVYQNGILKTTTSATFYTVSALSASTPYSFYIVAKDAAGNSSVASNTVNVNTLSVDTSAPTAPALTASGTTTSTTNLSWSAALDNVGVTGYNVYQNGILKTTTSATFYTVSALSASTPYSFYIVAKDAAGNSSVASNTVNVNTLSVDTSAPTAPALTASGTTTSTTNLSWSAALDNVGVTGYNVYQNGILKTTTSTTFYTVSALSASTPYGFYIVAKDAAGNSSVVSNTVNVITLSLSDTTAPTASTLTASGTTTSATNLSWSAASDNIGVASYSVYQNGILKATTSGTTYTVSGLSASTAYSFYAIAKDAAGNSSIASNTVNVTTLSLSDTTAPTTSTLTASGTTTSTTNLSWSPASDNVGVASYNVYQNGILKATTGSTTYMVSGLSASTTYGFYIIAKDAAGNSSAASNTSNTTTLANAAISYCFSSGSSTREYINRVQIGSINNLSGNNGGYANFTTLSTTMSLGTTNTISITPAWTGSTYSECYRIWIDFNHDGDFIDNGEQVFNQFKTRSSLINGTIYVPTTALPGATRMRITMKNNGLPTACETFNYGEVEDYTITIVASGRVEEENVSQLAIKLYPNPVTGEILNISNLENPSTYRIFNMIGQELMNDKIENGAVDVGSLKAGHYIIEVNNGYSTATKQFIKQ